MDKYIVKFIVWIATALATPILFSIISGTLAPGFMVEIGEQLSTRSENINSNMWSDYGAAGLFLAYLFYTISATCLFLSWYSIFEKKERDRINNILNVEKRVDKLETIYFKYGYIMYSILWLIFAIWMFQVSSVEFYHFSLGA